MDRTAAHLHTIIQCLTLCVQTGKCGQEAWMNVQNASSISFNEIAGKQTHVARETDKMYPMLGEGCYDLTIVFLPAATAARDDECLQSSLSSPREPRSIL